MSVDELCIGIVGCGGIAQVHADAIDRLQGAKLAACADIRPERAAAMAAKHGGKAYPSLDAMLEAERLDALHICTPHHLHAGMIEQGLAAGLHVFTEKPPVITRAEMDRLLARPDIGRVGVCFQNRWNPATARVRELLDEGELGAAVGIRAFVTWARSERYYTDSGWRGRWATEGGGALINQSIHTLDLMLLFMGEVTECRAMMGNDHLRGTIEVEDTAAIYLRFGQRPGLLYATTAYAVDAPVLIEIECERGALRIEGTEVGVRRGAGPWAFATAEDQKPGEKGYWGNGHLACIEAFCHSVRTGAPFAASFAAVAPTVSAMLSCYEQNRCARNQDE